jgi:alpha-ketoglutarate-dependent taurine dioxygenase
VHGDEKNLDAAGEEAEHEQPMPPKAAMLDAPEVSPPEGGNTYFANMFAAYEALAADLKKAIEGELAVHDASRSSNSTGCEPGLFGGRTSKDAVAATSQLPAVMVPKLAYSKDEGDFRLR